MNMVTYIYIFVKFISFIISIKIFYRFVMEIRNIKTFVRLTEIQNFSKVAQQTGYSQSAITIQIKLLEEELGAKLFERIGKRVKLTGKPVAISCP